MYTRRNLALSLVLAVSMVGISYGVGGDMGAATEPLTDGSAAYPYLIEDLADFDVFADQANAVTYWSSGVYTKLTCDIDLAGKPPYTTAVIAPDTPDTNWYFNGIPFGGVFDGDGHTISNLTIDAAGADNAYLGLFGCIYYFGGVKNIGIENANITSGNSSHHLSGLCGYSTEGTISNCYVTGSVIGGDNSNYLGGLCGYDFYGNTITNCYATCSVTGGSESYYIGGLYGLSDHGTIINCYATGFVTGGSYLGGLCGCNYYGTITNCYATGFVTGGNYLGGLSGYDSGVIEFSFWDTQTSGMTTSEGGTGKTTAEMQTRSTFTDAGWDFTGEDVNGTDDIWDICEAINYPKLSWQFLAGDFTCPDGINLIDFAVLADTWSLSSGQAGYNDLCDLIDDDTIDLNDLAVFAGNWLRD